MKRVLITAAAVVLGIFLALGTAEVLIRVIKPAPRIQIVRETDNVRLFTMDGVPVWEKSTDRQHLDCPEAHPDAIRIMIFGSSILYGTDLPAKQAFSTLLERKLNALNPSPGYCVMNLSQPGFSFEAKYALAHEYVPRYLPQIIFWENWQSGPSRYVMRGETAYNFQGIEIEEDGYPSVFGLPSGMNAWLFTNSRLFEYATIALARYAPTGPEQWSRFYRERMPQVADLARSVDAKLALVLCPQLDRTFEESAANLWTPYADLIAYARERGIPYFRLEEELAGQNFLSLRQDSCCHYSAEGHAALADVFLRRTFELLGKGSGEASQ